MVVHGSATYQVKAEILDGSKHSAVLQIRTKNSWFKQFTIETIKTCISIVKAVTLDFEKAEPVAAGL